MPNMTTPEIRALLIGAHLDFETVENRALNNYLPKILPSCPFTNEICTGKQCVECDSFKNRRE